MHESDSRGVVLSKSYKAQYLDSLKTTRFETHAKKKKAAKKKINITTLSESDSRISLIWALGTHTPNLLLTTHD